MADDHSDLDAVKKIVEALQGFDAANQQRIMRWVSEKVGLELRAGPAIGQTAVGETRPTEGVTPPSSPRGGMDIRSFIAAKAPSSDVQFAAAVAYFYAFEAAPAEQKKAIVSDDLQDACRRVGRERLVNPGQTLRNACHLGLLDKAEDRGAYKINTVGENLVAVTLPGDATGPASRKSPRGKSRRKAPATARAKTEGRRTRHRR